MVAIIIEPAYSECMWGKSLLNSLTSCLKQKRIPFCIVDDSLLTKYDGVFVIGTNYNWLKAVLLTFNASGIKPILLCNQTENIAGCSYCSVGSDVSDSMQSLLKKLSKNGKSRIALYGVNNDSVLDIGRKNELLTLRGDYLTSVFKRHFRHIIKMKLQR